MKTIFKFLLVAVGSCIGLFAQAQNCGVNADFAFTANPNNPYMFQFADSSHFANGWVSTSQVWNFGDSSYATTANPNHTYNHPGIYTVCLYETAQLQGSSTTCTDTFCRTVNICNGMVQPHFSYSTQGDTLYIGGSGGGNYPPFQYTWDFGDGHHGVVQQLSHIYSTSGTYHVCLTVQDANGCEGDTCTDIVIQSSQNNCGQLHASFTHAITQAGLVLTSNSTGTTANTLYQWTFDGSNLTNPNPNTSYTFQAPSGNHTICLKVFPSPGAQACDDTCITFYITNNSQCGNIPADFTSYVSGGTLTDSAAHGYPAGSMYQWWLDGQSTQTSTSPAYTWTGLSNGVHQNCLYIYTANGYLCDSVCHSVTINNPNPCQGHASFQFSVVNDTVNFSGAANPTGTVFHWNFGDQTDISTNSHYVSHVYPADTIAHVYYVCLYVYIPGTVCVDSFCHAVTVPAHSSTPPPCHAYFSWNLTSNLAGGVVFHNYSTPASNAHSWLWTFGDGDSSTAFAPTHQYPNQHGAYQVCLTMVSPNGCTSTWCDSVYVTPLGGNCTSHFSWNQTGLPCGNVQFTNLSTGNYTGVYWSFGDGSSSSIQNPLHHYASPGSYSVVLTTFGGNCQISSTQVVQVNSCTSINDTICGTVFNDANSNGVMDSGETVIAGAQVHIGNHIDSTDANGHYQIILPASNYYVYMYGQSGCIATVPLHPNSNAQNNNYLIHGMNGGTFCGYDFGFNCNLIHVCGVVYYDGNANNVQDSSESGIANVHVQITGSNGVVHHAYTNANGEYCVTLPLGIYTVTVVPTNYQTCTVAPAQITVTAVNLGNYYGNNNFAVQCPPGNCDLMVHVVPHTTVTAGYPAWYSIQVCNVGNSASGGTVNMFFSPDLQFSSSNPLPASVNTSTHTVTWNQATLLPGHCAYYWVTFTANQNVAVGTPAFTLVNLTPDGTCNDVDLVNNVDTIHQAFTASWDPNNKLAYVTNYDDPQYQLVSSINPNQRIEYVINFQNEGNAPAVNVVVNDEISTDLDLTSFELLGSSHPCLTSISGRTVNFKFSDIMLPDAITDETASHGWVRFAINSINGLPANHVISDDAAIYFDYNSPVMTNDAAVIMLEPSGVNDLPVNTTVVVAPNPMNTFTQIKLDSPQKGFRFRVTDLTGRIIADETTSNNTLQFDRNSLASGIYLYEVIQNNQKVAQGKLVME